MFITPESGCALRKSLNSRRWKWCSVLLLPAAALAQSPEPIEEIPLETDIPPQTHANRPAPSDLLQEAGLRPSSFVGKMLVLHDTEGEMEVGPVLEIQRHRENQKLYLIVDATRYFKTETEYAVAVNDVARLEETRIIVTEAPGMHLRGIEYYAEDYEDVDPALTERRQAE